MSAPIENLIAIGRRRSDDNLKLRHANWDAIFTMESAARALGDKHPLHKMFLTNTAERCRKVLAETQP